MLPDIFITTKVPAEIKTYEGAVKHIEESLANLGVDYIDLHLIHAPWPWHAIGMDCKDGNVEVWKALIEYYNAGKIRAIGVSNFSVQDIEYIVEKTNFKGLEKTYQASYGYIQEWRFAIAGSKRRNYRNQKRISYAEKVQIGIYS